jgi:predicted tellurium resistance membrane protein TerC
LAFLMLIGMSLVAEGFHQHIPKGYIYAAMAFSVVVELVNLRVRSQADRHPVHLNDEYTDEERAAALGQQRNPAQS